MDTPKNLKIVFLPIILAVLLSIVFTIYFSNGTQANITEEVIIEKVIYMPQNDTLVLKEIFRKLVPNLDQVILDAILINTIKYAKEYVLPETLILAIIERESKFNPLAVSSKGAAGLMQVMLKVHQDKLTELKISSAQAMHISNNIHLGCIILREYLDDTNDIKQALRKYVGGLHSTYYTDVLSWYTTINMLILEKQNAEETFEKEIEEKQRENKIDQS
jgi:hypothetical protein